MATQPVEAIPPLQTTPAFANPGGQLATIPFSSCAHLLRTHHVGRVGFVEDGTVTMLPVNYAYIAESIVFRSAPGAKVDHAERAGAMSFEIDGWDDDAKVGWSVLAKGVGEVVTDDWLTDMFDYLGAVPWLNDVPRDEWVRIRVATITGRRIEPSD